MAGRRPTTEGESPIPAGVTLLQQTPLDTAVGDALAQFGGRGVLLEFKRREEDVAGEYETKPGKAAFVDWLLDAVRAAKEGAYWRQAHFVGYGTPAADGPLAFLPYVCVAPREARRCPDARLGTRDFIDRLLRSADTGATAGVPIADMRAYVATIAAFHGQDGAEDDATGFLVHVTADGVVHTVPYRGLKALAQSLQQVPTHTQPSHEAAQAGYGTASSTGTPKQTKSRGR